MSTNLTFENTDTVLIENRVFYTSGSTGKPKGVLATPDELDFVPNLPKTRSGKIMRRVVRAKELGEPVGDLSTLDA